MVKVQKLCMHLALRWLARVSCNFPTAILWPISAIILSQVILQYWYPTKNLRRWIGEPTTIIFIRATELELYLTKGGHKNRFVKSQIARAKLIPRNDALNEHNHDTPKPTRVPFIVTYNSALPNIREILHKKQPSSIFSETPVVAFRRLPNLGDLLVRAKLKTPESNTLHHPPGTFRCNSRQGCLTCPNIDDGRTTYTLSTTGETREIKQHFTFKSNNVTYMTECKKM